MKNYLSNINNNLHRYDIIGFQKLIRYLAQQYINLASIQDPIAQIEFENKFSHELITLDTMLSHTYLYSPVTSIDPSNLKVTLLTTILRLIQNNLDLTLIKTHISETIPEEEILSLTTNKSYLITDPHVSHTKACILRLGTEQIVMNGLLKYALLLRNKSNQTVLLDNLTLLIEPYIPTIIGEFLSKHINYKFIFTDDSRGNRPGTTITIFYIDSYGKAHNPVMCIPLYGGQIAYTIDMFDQPQAFDLYFHLFSTIFCVKFESLSPEKHIVFLANRGLTYNISADFGAINNHLKQNNIDYSSNVIASDVAIFGGSEYGTLYLMHQLIASYGKVNPEVSSAESQFEKTYIYDGATLYYKHRLPEEDIEYLLNTFVLSQLRKFYPICLNYLQIKHNIRPDMGKLVNTGQQTYYDIWGSNNNLLDPTNLKGIATWLVETHYNFNILGTALTTEYTRKVFKIVTLLTTHVALYYKLVSPTLGITSVTVNNISFLGLYELTLSHPTQGMLSLQGYTPGFILPTVSEVTLTSSSELPINFKTLFQRCAHCPVRSALTYKPSMEEVIFKDNEHILLWNTETAGPIYLTTEDLKSSNLHFPNISNTTVTSEGSTLMKLTWGSSQYSYTIDNSKALKIYQLQPTGNHNITSDLASFKSSFFDF